VLGVAEFSCSGDGLGAVGRTELAEDVADVLAPSCRPASAEDSTSYVHHRVTPRPGGRS
jgi:hypothetical protein